MKFFKIDFPIVSARFWESPVFCCFNFLYLLDSKIGHHIEDMMQKGE